MNILEAHNISKNYSGYQALSNVTVNIPESGIVGLLGPNGAGKTSFIRIITQITHQDSGEIFFKGEKLASSHIFQTGYLPEERGLYKKMKVKEQVIFLARLKGLSFKDAKKRAEDWLELLELSKWQDSLVEELSKGMQQKVQFIAAVIHEPSLIILDEPFTGFDPVNADLIKKEIIKLKEKGCAVIFSTHRMDSIEELCDHIVMFNKSKKILEGTVQSVKNEFKTNTFVVEGEGILNDNDHFDILKEEKKNGLNSFRVKAKSGIQENQMLELLMKSMSIKLFKEEIPSIEDIFISKVKQSNL